MSFWDNWQRVLARVEQAAKRAGRSTSEIVIVAVSKTRTLEEIQAAFLAGQRTFGENKPQELCAKQQHLPQADWHLIGNLQTNKVKYIAPFVQLIHSLDSNKLAVEINRQAEKNQRVISCLLQFNISNEPSKGGISHSELDVLLQQYPSLPNLRIEGLMGMAQETDNNQLIYKQFYSLFQLRERLLAEHKSILGNLPILSMGMSNDFEIAIEAGATHIRIGSILFGNRA